MCVEPTASEAAQIEVDDGSVSIEYALGIWKY
jgi:hypothetical protein